MGPGFDSLISVSRHFDDTPGGSGPRPVTGRSFDEMESGKCAKSWQDKYPAALPKARHAHTVHPAAAQPKARVKVPAENRRGREVILRRVVAQLPGTQHGILRQYRCAGQPFIPGHAPVMVTRHYGPKDPGVTGSAFCEALQHLLKAGRTCMKEVAKNDNLPGTGIGCALAQFFQHACIRAFRQRNAGLTKDQRLAEVQIGDKKPRGRFIKRRATGQQVEWLPAMRDGNAGALHGAPTRARPV